MVRDCSGSPRVEMRLPVWVDIRDCARSIFCKEGRSFGIYLGRLRSEHVCERTEFFYLDKVVMSSLRVVLPPTAARVQGGIIAEGVGSGGFG